MSSVELLHYVTKSVTFVFISLKLVVSFFSWEQKFSFVGLDFIMEGMVSPVLGGVMVSPWGGGVYCKEAHLSSCQEWGELTYPFYIRPPFQKEIFE